MKIVASILVFLLVGAGTAFKIPAESIESKITSQSDEESKDPIDVNLGKEITDLTDGDIAVSEQMKQELKNSKSGVSKRNAQRDRRYLWSGAVVPYEIDTAAFEGTNAIDVINAAIAEYHTRTCIKFVQKTDQVNWIKFVKKTGCWSFIGRQFSTPGAQEVSLGKGCYYKKTAVHELMHALGFWHEQSRPDRDQHVDIYWENIDADKESNFVKYNSDVVDTLGVNYDYKSIVHYNGHAFSRNGRITLTAKGDPQNTRDVGNADTLSNLDVIKIDLLYCKDSSSLGAYSNGPIPDGSFSSSSYKDYYGTKMFTANHGRLKDGSAWCASSASDLASQYLEIDLESVKSVRAVATQGSEVFEDWVMKYTIKYSSDKSTWAEYSENGAVKVFPGNVDKTTVVENVLASPVSARYIRFCPKEVHGLPCMRIDVYTEAAKKVSPWSLWGPCNRESCIKQRQRYCKSVNVAECQSADAHGVETQSLACTQEECNAPVDGHWSRWGAWSSCSKSCGEGSHTRGRTCSDPAPLSGGKECEGSNTMSGSCLLTPCELIPEGCAFTTDYCKWTQDPDKDIPWYRRSYTTPSSGTGPSEDHTSPDGSGYYIYLEGSGVAASSKAILRSADQAGSNTPNCLSFYYHMYGQTMGTLNVKIKTLSTGATTNLATLSGNSGDKWIEKKITFSSAESFVVQFEGIRGSQWSSDMALDDIGLKSGACA